MRDIIGIHDGHNAAAALLSDGRIVSALQEERLTGNKNQGGIPRRAVDCVLVAAGLDLDDVPQVALNGNHISYQHLERESLLQHYQESGSLAEQLKQPLKQTFIYEAYRRSKSAERERRLVEAGFRAPQLRPVDHHACHAAAAYYGSGWTTGRVLVLTCDGSGDNLSATVSVAENGRIERIASVPANDSLGRVYSMVTFMLGMMPLEHEYKVMGLAPYVGDAGKATRAARMFHDMFEFDPTSPMVWRRRKGIPSMFASHDFFRRILHRQRFDLVSAGVQQFIEDMLTRWVSNCIEETGIRRVACSGGVFMNVKANKAILELPAVDELFIFPSCGDETNSIGAAYEVHAQERLAAGLPVDIEPIGPIYWGPSFTDAEVEEELERFSWAGKVRFRHVDDIERTVANALAGGDIVARAKGPMEFGARSLGNRAILSRADDMEAVRTINEMIKNRDFWMPFAPSVLAERAEDYYIKPKPVTAPYMVLAFDSRPEARARYRAGQHPYDHTARPQEVTPEHNADYHRLLKYYEEATGEGIILNTSFNLHGFPLVNRPVDALEVMRESGLQHLALGNWWVSKE